LYIQWLFDIIDVNEREGFIEEIFAENQIYKLLEILRKTWSMLARFKQSVSAIIESEGMICDRRTDHKHYFWSTKHEQSR